MSKASELAVLDNESLTPAMFRNLFANGDFLLASGGTFMGAGEGNGSKRTDDAWRNWYLGTGLAASQQILVFPKAQTDVPGNPKHYSRTTVTTPATSGNYFVRKQQQIEGGRTVCGEWLTLSFWAKANAPKTLHYAMERNLGDFGGALPLPINEEFALTASWQKYTRTFYIPDISAVVEEPSYIGVITGYFQFSASAANGPSSVIGQVGVFDIARVKLERGKHATDWEPLPIEIELARCERKIEYQTVTHRGYAAAGAVTGAWVPYRVRKWVGSPSVTFTSASTLDNCTSISAINSSPDGVVLQVVVSVTGAYAFTANIQIT